MEMYQLRHQESVTANLQKLTSNPGPLLPITVLWFQLSWGDLIILPLIMVMLRFTLQSFQFNITINMLQIQTPLQSNQFMMIKCTIYWDYSNHNMMKIFWMLISRCFRRYWWSPLLQNLNSLYCFVS